MDLSFNFKSLNLLTKNVDIIRSLISEGVTNILEFGWQYRFYLHANSHHYKNTPLYIAKKKLKLSDNLLHSLYKKYKKITSSWDKSIKTKPRKYKSFIKHYKNIHIYNHHKYVYYRLKYDYIICERLKLVL